VAGPIQVRFILNGTSQMVHTILVYLNEAGAYDFNYEGTDAMYINRYPGSGANLTAAGGIQHFRFVARTRACFQMLGVRRRGILAGSEAERPEYPRSGL